MTETVTLESAIQQANDLRSRIQAGETVPREELASALRNLRAGRSSAAQTKRSSAAKKEPAKPLDLAGLFSKPVEKE